MNEMVDGKKEGYWEESDSFGNYRGNYLNGERDGEWSFFNNDNILTQTVGFKNGILHGTRKDFSLDKPNNGNPWLETVYDNGVCEYVIYRQTSIQRAKTIVKHTIYILPYRL